jgi:hypothetical protein
MLASMTKQDGIRIREARRARVRRIRARVIGGSVALFLAVWMVITVVLLTGHDPALAHKALTQSATGTTTSIGTGASGATGVTSTGSTGSGSGSSVSGSGGASGSSSSTGATSSGATSSSTGSDPSGVSPVTSSQS